MNELIYLVGLYSLVSTTLNASTPPCPSMNRPVRAPAGLSLTCATPFESIALLLQGGGALGSYQAGVYEALLEHGIEPTGPTLTAY